MGYRPSKLVNLVHANVSASSHNEDSAAEERLRRSADFEDNSYYFVGNIILSASVSTVV
jgi:hypothetical protein